MSPLPLLACFLLLGGLILALLYAIRRGIQEQQELDALSDLVEYEDEGCDCATNDFLRTHLQARNIETGEPWVCPVCGDDGTFTSPHFSGAAAPAPSQPTPTEGAALPR